MNYEELAQLIPDMVDGTLSADVLAEARATLPQCPDCQREFEIASQVRAFLIQLQAEHADLRVPAGFEARLIARVRAQSNGVELLDLSSKIFGVWLVELINLIGGLLVPGMTLGAGQVRPDGA
jgi:anti-sigma factor RsiW